MLARRMTLRARIVLALCAVALGAAGLSACGTEKVEVAEGGDQLTGAKIFDARCSGCHTLGKAGAQGGAFDIKDRERVDGPSFDARKETVAQVLYAIRNGGFSGAIMPENIVTGREAALVAEFLAKNSGKQSESESTPPSARP